MARRRQPYPGAFVDDIRVISVVAQLKQSLVAEPARRLLL